MSIRNSIELFLFCLMIYISNSTDCNIADLNTFISENGLATHDFNFDCITVDDYSQYLTDFLQNCQFTENLTAQTFMECSAVCTLRAQCVAFSFDGLSGCLIGEDVSSTALSGGNLVGSYVNLFVDETAFKAFIEGQTGPCMFTPCGLYGMCEQLDCSTYQCHCPTYRDGFACEIDVDECQSSPCLNGVCTDVVNGYTCDCSGTGYTGVHCEVEVDECASSPCENGGICSDAQNAFNCNCDGTGFSGTTCSVSINECASSPCVNGAGCTDGINSYTCVCPTYFEGTHCEVFNFVCPTDTLSVDIATGSMHVLEYKEGCLGNTEAQWDTSAHSLLGTAATFECDYNQATLGQLFDNTAGGTAYAASVCIEVNNAIGVECQVQGYNYSPFQFDLGYIPSGNAWDLVCFPPERLGLNYNYYVIIFIVIPPSGEVASIRGFHASICHMTLTGGGGGGGGGGNPHHG